MIPAALYSLAVVVPYLLAAAIVTTELAAFPSALTAMAVVAAIATIAVIVPIPARSVFIGAIGVAIVVIVLSGSALAVAAAFLITLVGYAVGVRVVSLLGAATDAGSGERLAYELVLGIGAVGYLAFALGVAGGLNVPLAALGLAGLAAFGFSGPRRELWQRAAVPSGRASPVLVLCAGTAVVVLIHAVAPEIQYDALSYHLGLPREYIAAGAIVDRPEQPQSYYYRTADMSFAMAMLLGGQTAAKMLSALFLPLGALAITSFGRREFGERVARWGALLFAFTPLMLWSATTTYVDGIAAVLAFVNVTAAYRAAERRRPADAVLAGILAGLALATKLTTILVIAPVFGYLVVRCLRVSGRSARVPVLFSACAAALVAPWAVWTAARTGNPVFPFLNTLFRSPDWPAVNETFGLARFGLHGFATPFGPARATFDAMPFVDGLVGPVIGVGIMLAPLSLMRSRRGALPALLVAGLGGVVLWTFSFQYLRYLTPVIGPLSLATAVTIDDLAPHLRGAAARVAARAPDVLAFAGFVLWLWTYPGVLRDVVPLGVAFGAETGAAYLSRTLVTYAPLAAVASAGGPASRVLIASCEGGADDEDRLYAPGRVETCESPWTRALYAIRDEEAVSAALRERGVTHILLLGRGVREFMATSPVVSADFLGRHGTLEFAQGTVRLYRLASSP